MSSSASAREGRVKSGACAGTGGGAAGEEPPFDPDGARWQRPSFPFLFPLPASGHDNDFEMVTHELHGLVVLRLLGLGRFEREGLF